MPREWRLEIAGTIAVVGVILGLALVCYAHNEHDADVLRQTAKQIGEAEQARTVATVALEDARVTARAAGVDAKAAVARALAARARARIVDATNLIVLAKPNGSAIPIQVPEPVVERMQLDSGAITALGTLVRWKDTVIVRQDQRISADSLELAATSNAFTMLQREKEPRCGRKCGIVLGVGGMLAAAVTIEQVRRAFR